MTAEYKRNWYKSVKLKIAVLPVMGLIGILCVEGFLLYQNKSVNDAMAVKDFGAALSDNSSELFMLESIYLNSLDQEALKSIEALTGAVSGLLDEKQGDTDSKEINVALKELKTDIENHITVFQTAADSKRSIRDLRIQLAERFRSGDEQLFKAVETITEEETQLIMTGDDLADNKVATRDSFKEFIGFSSAQMLNITDLLAFEDAENYQAVRADLEKKIGQSLKNINGMMTSIEEENIQKMWARVKADQEAVVGLENSLFETWKKSKAQLLELEGTSSAVRKMVQNFSALTTSQFQHTRDRNMKVNYLVTAGVLILLFLLSIVTVRRIVRPLSPFHCGLAGYCSGRGRPDSAADS